ncbi:CDP-glycerol glycerophosphotransferase family protein [Aquibacillus koreensis]|uniref:CDP-glycerol glycerophosphotransferase family protein n=1 Tax=Aquibacillus koreensis TaxID=279446 RepID=A0A9X3WHE4_9BACI|nr:glycosyltransferase [Aquibacillus koreensis]MCT2535288.1 CDP-glycerol glycerophosphotransferase family protein [Aquibacillus koreensis]MDC3419780.1 CDP-glycerol glycerophosphotransferase family protein [Aquibacillus koreensis]
MQKKLKRYIKRKIPFIKKPIQEYNNNQRFQIRSKYNRFINKYKVKDNVILYESYHGANFTGNPLAIFQNVLKDEAFSHYKHVIVNNNKELLDETYNEYNNVSIVSVEDDEYLLALATSKYLINNTSFPYYFLKRKEQVYINTWHGTPLKTLGLDINNAGFSDHMNIQRNLLQTDFLLSPNSFTYNKLLSSHDIKEIFPGKVLDIGYPRVDLTLNSNRDGVLRDLALPLDKKIVLYAPTWRGTVGNESDTSQQLLDEVVKLRDQLGNDYIVLLKSHYFAYKFFEDNGLEHMCIPNHYDTNTLLAAVDLLITDYSSIFFEFIPTGRPIVFYGEDIELYKEERGFYLEIDSLPGPLCTDIDEVANCIINEHYNYYQENYQKYNSLFNYNDDGKAGLRFKDIVFHNKESDLIKTTNSGKEIIMMYCGAFYNNGITMSALSLLDNIDYDKYEVIVVESPNGTEEKWNNMRKVNENVHFLFRPGVLGRTIMESYRHQWTLNRGISGSVMKLIVPKKMYKKEMKRITGNLNINFAINFGGYNDFWSLLFAFSGIKKKTIYLHNDMMEEFNKKINGKNKHKQALKVVFSTYKYYEKIISVAESTHHTNFENLKHLVPYAEDKMTYINNSVNYKKVLDLKDQDNIVTYDKKDYMILENKKQNNFVSIKGSLTPNPHYTNFVSIGRLSPEKDHEKLINAFYKALNNDDHMKLYIVGEGPLKGYLEDLISKLNLTDKVILVGQVENPFALIKQCDCFILSSNYEGQGLVLLETMIINKPIIATDVTGVRSVLEGGYGKLIENNVHDLADSLKEFALNKRNGVQVNYKKFDYVQYNKDARDRFNQIVL